MLEAPRFFTLHVSSASAKDPFLLRTMSTRIPAILNLCLSACKQLSPKGMQTQGSASKCSLKLASSLSLVHYFQPLVWEVHVIVELYEDRGEYMAGRTPVGSEEQANHLAGMSAKVTSPFFPWNVSPTTDCIFPNYPIEMERTDL